MPKFSFRSDFDMFWPETDHAPVKCFQRVMARYRDADEVTRRCPKKRLAIQAGGHAGVWANRLSASFQRVLTYEPDPNLFQCLIRNIKSPNVEAFELALGESSGVARMKPHPSAGSWKIDPDGTVEVGMTVIDELGLAHCDAILLDIEGHEMQALEGAKQTINKFRPVILLEEGKRKEEIRAYMAGKFKYRLDVKTHDDGIFVPC